MVACFSILLVFDANNEFCLLIHHGRHIPWHIRFRKHPILRTSILSTSYRTISSRLTRLSETSIRSRATFLCVKSSICSICSICSLAPSVYVCETYLGIGPESLTTLTFSVRKRYLMRSLKIASSLLCNLEAVLPVACSCMTYKFCVSVQYSLPRTLLERRTSGILASSGTCPFLMMSYTPLHTAVTSAVRNQTANLSYACFPSRTETAYHRSTVRLYPSSPPLSSRRRAFWPAVIPPLCPLRP